MTILVSGATGTVGRHVVDRLVQAGADVRALIRRPESAELPSAVRVVSGDLESAESLGSALEGVDSMYLIAAGDTGEVADLAKHAGVRRVVVLSSASAAWEDDLGGEYHRATERAVEDSGLEWTHLRPGMFAANLTDWADIIRAEGVVRQPYEQARQAPIDEFDVGSAAAHVLLSEGHTGHIYTLSGPESLSKAEQMASIGSVIGRDLRFEELTPEQWSQQVEHQLPSYVIDWLLKLWKRTTLEPEHVLPAVEDLLGRPARTVSEWAADHAEDFR